MEKKTIKPQKVVPTKDNKWYILKEAGGYSPCINGVPEYFKGSALANCVGYSWGRFAEIHNDKNCKIGCAPGNKYPASAYAWIDYSKAQGFKISNKAVLGAVAVWVVNSGKWGHVANVEYIDENGSLWCSESGYDSYVFKYRKYPASGYKAGYTFLGFILPKYEFYIEGAEPKPTTQKFKIGEKVVINGNLYYSSNATAPSGIIYNKTTYITRYAAGSKHPYNTTGDLGWMDEKDIHSYKVEELKAGDTVRILSTGRASASGSGGVAGGLGWTRTILAVHKGQQYPYQVGTKGKGTTGFYKASALQKV